MHDEYTVITGRPPVPGLCRSDALVAHAADPADIAWSIEYRACRVVHEHTLGKLGAIGELHSPRCVPSIRIELFEEETANEFVKTWLPYIFGELVHVSRNVPDCKKKIGIK